MSPSQKQRQTNTGNRALCPHHFDNNNSTDLCPSCQLSIPGLQQCRRSGQPPPWNIPPRHAHTPGHPFVQSIASTQNTSNEPIQPATSLPFQSQPRSAWNTGPIRYLRESDTSLIAAGRFPSDRDALHLRRSSSSDNAPRGRQFGPGPESSSRLHDERSVSAVARREEHPSSGSPRAQLRAQRRAPLSAIEPERFDVVRRSDSNGRRDDRDRAAEADDTDDSYVLDGYWDFEHDVRKISGPQPKGSHGA